MLPIFMAEPIRDIRVIRGSHSFVRVHWCSFVVKSSVAAEPPWVIGGSLLRVYSSRSRGIRG
jgi:hypothetical protein